MIEGFMWRMEQESLIHLQGWRVTRWVGSLIWNVNRGKRSAKSPQRLYELPYDRERMKPEDVEEAREKVTQLAKRRKWHGKQQA